MSNSTSSSSSSWFHSERVKFCQLLLRSESAYHIMNLLGNEAICQFSDLNHSLNAFQKKFSCEIQRCKELENKIALFEKELKHENIEIIIESNEDQPDIPTMRDIIRLEQRIEQVEKLLTEHNFSLEFKRNLLSLTEFNEILNIVDLFIQKSEQINPNMNRRMSTVDQEIRRRFSIISQNSQENEQIPKETVVDLITIAGCIVASKFLMFERILWRLSRHNIFLIHFPMEKELEDPETGEMQNKIIFFMSFQGKNLRQTCERICSGFRANIYRFPETKLALEEAMFKTKKEIHDLQEVIHVTNDYRKNILVSIAKNIHQWKIMVKKVKIIYEAMNLFSNRITDQYLIAQCWIPENRLDNVRVALIKGQTITNSTLPSMLNILEKNETPPTYNKTNKLTSGFQNIINSYGIASYGEINPSPFCIITFPFIFALMFGDMGHGIIMFLFALWMVIQEERLKFYQGEVFQLFFAGRYIILLMGLFSIYTGLIYNDMFSKSVNFFGTSFGRNLSQIDNFNQSLIHLEPSKVLFDDRYYIGIDPIWQLSENKVQYLNTYKMKLSVIIGVSQMLFGVVLSLFNHIYHRKIINIIGEFIPQIIFLLGIFGYMNFMIFFKWFTYTDKESARAPSILITMINMFMFKMPADNDPAYLKEEMFSGQFNLQKILIIIALICIPIMLLFKPLFLLRQNRQKIKNAIKNNNQNMVDELESYLNDSDLNSVTNSGNSASKPNNQEQFNFGDIFINQTIHTIEYCLGSISHTASYLRLWALSLAHTQLSEVLWNMILKMGFDSFIMMFILFGVWAFLTVAILILMEGLSAFLHALRLHWVEFMSKFYNGNGYAFQPFSFQTLMCENI